MQRGKGMENIFSLTEAKMLSKEAFSPRGDGFFMLYQLSGSAAILCAEEPNELSPNEATKKRKITLSPDEVYVGKTNKSYSLQSTAENSVIFISVSGELTEGLSSLYGIFDGFSAKAPESREAFEEIRLILSDTDLTESERTLKGSLELHRLMHVLHKSAGTRLVRRTALRMKDYIDTHLEEKTNLDTLARVFFMSRTQLHRLFKDEYGVSPIRYLTGRRVELSKKLLKNENLKLSEIAETLCFSDAKHFSKTFLKYEGILPSEYRKNIKQHLGEAL